MNRIPVRVPLLAAVVAVGLLAAVTMPGALGRDEPDLGTPWSGRGRSR